MTNQQLEQKKYKFKDSMGNKFMYVVLDQQGAPIGKGCSGEVYKVKGEDKKLYALKICITSHKEDFQSNAEGLYQDQNNLEHFIKTLKVGDVEEGTGNVPAMIMEYGGTNLQKVCEYLGSNPKSVSANVREAFKYKVLVTVAEGLAHAEEKELGEEKKGIYHGDLIPSNILCGFDLNEVASDVAKLEKALLNKRITLCDRLINEKVGTKALGGPSYTQGLPPNALFFDTYCPSLSPAGNSYSFLALWSWLASGSNEKMLPVDMFAQRKKFTFTFDDEKFVRQLDLVQYFSELLGKEIDMQKYFFKMQTDLLNDIHFPLFYRPVDRFEVFSSQQEFSDVNYVMDYYTNNECCYLKMKDYGGTKSTLDEKNKMEHIFGETILRNVTRIDNLIEELVASRKPFRDEENAKLGKLSGFKTNVTDEENKMTKATNTITTLVGRISQEIENTTIADELKKEQKRLTLAKAKLAEYKKNMKENEEKIIELQKKQEQYDDSVYLGILKCVKESLLPEVVDEVVKTKISALLKKCGI